MRTVLVAALCLAGCAASNAESAAPLSGRAPVEPRRAAPPDTGSEADQVRVAVFRYLVRHNASAGQTRVPFICLEVLRVDRLDDPSPFVMAAMSRGAVRVVPGSACDASVNGVFLKADRAAGRGLVFRTEKVEIEGDKATVTGGYYEAGLSASGNVYVVERQRDGSWQVTKDTMEWIS